MPGLTDQSHRLHRRETGVRRLVPPSAGARVDRPSEQDAVATEAVGVAAPEVRRGRRRVGRVVEGAECTPAAADPVESVVLNLPVVPDVVQAAIHGVAEKDESADVERSGSVGCRAHRPTEAGCLLRIHVSGPAAQGLPGRRPCRDHGRALWLPPTRLPTPTEHSAEAVVVTAGGATAEAIGIPPVARAAAIIAADSRDALIMVPP